MPFPTTRWNLLDALKAGTADTKREALGDIILLYGGPLYAFARRQTHGLRGREDCEDLVNDFFLKCVEGDVLERADQARGKFRNFLAKSFKRHILNDDRGRHAQKREPAAGPPISLQSFTDDPGLEPRTNETPEAAFDRVLRRSLFERLVSDFRGRCERAEQMKKFELFLLREVEPRRNGTPEPSYASLADRLKPPSENAVNKIVLAARKEFRALILAEVGRDCASQKEAEVECELVFNVDLQS